HLPGVQPCLSRPRARWIMSFWRIVLKSLTHHRFSNGLAAISIAMGIALLVAVYSFKEQSHNTFTQVGLGVDAILGPKGSPLQIVLNAVYHLEDMPGKIKWTYRASENSLFEN
ncbi:MAG: hypothetical protein JSU78_04795, partial [Deltaproteobacteria bacterium]